MGIRWGCGGYAPKWRHPRKIFCIASCTSVAFGTRCCTAQKLSIGWTKIPNCSSTLPAASVRFLKKIFASSGKVAPIDDMKIRNLLCKNYNASVLVASGRGRRIYRKTVAWWSRHPLSTKTPKSYPAVFEASYSPLVTSSSLADLASLEFCIYPGSTLSKNTTLF